MDKIAMIKEVRNLTGCGLKEAKETVEEFQSGDALPPIKELMAKVAIRVKDKQPRSQEYRKYIITAIQQIEGKAEQLRGLLDEEWDDFAGARQTLSEIPGIIDRLSRLISKLEEVLYEESGTQTVS